MRFHVEAWSPEYGTSAEDGVGLAQTDAKVDVSPEVAPCDWKGIAASQPACDDVVFVDGVRRVDANLWMEVGGGVRQCVCASYAAGAVRCNGAAGVDVVKVERTVVGTAGVDRVDTRFGRYEAHRVAGEGSEQLILGVQHRMRDLEVQVAHAASGAGIVVVDGPLMGRESVPNAIGYVKSHHRSYLPEEQERVLSGLLPHERTPLFLMTTSWSRWSWYQRLPGPKGHPWAGVVRCEASQHLDLSGARALADLAVATLGKFASAPHKDTRAPQNLYPIAGLERELRRYMGDAELLRRGLAEAANRSQ